MACSWSWWLLGSIPFTEQYVNIEDQNMEPLSLNSHVCLLPCWIIEFLACRVHTPLFHIRTYVSLPCSSIHRIRPGGVIPRPVVYITDATVACTRGKNQVKKLLYLLMLLVSQNLMLSSKKRDGKTLVNNFTKKFFFYHCIFIFSNNNLQAKGHLQRRLKGWEYCWADQSWSFLQTKYHQHLSHLGPPAQWCSSAMLQDICQNSSNFLCQSQSQMPRDKRWICLSKGSMNFGPAVCSSLHQLVDDLGSYSGPLWLLACSHTQPEPG